MSDLIRRTEAIKRIRALWSEAWGNFGDEYYDNEYAKALQDAIDAIIDCFDAEQTEPKTEVKSMYCQECKHFEYDEKYKMWHCPLQDNGMYECNYEPKGDR